MSDDQPTFSAEDDSGMRAASRMALETFRYFWRELTWDYRRIIPACELAAVKAPFSDAGAAHVEYMWVSDVEFDGATVSGNLLNTPNKLRSIRQGARVELPLERLSDWLYALQGKAYGGFTVQHIRRGMSAEERASHDEAWGFDFAAPDTFRLSPWPDAEHPMSENMADGLKAAIEKDPNGWFELGDSGLNTLHSMALGGSEACVRVLLECGADRGVKTRDGRTALQLAQMMGWPRVVRLLST